MPAMSPILNFVTMAFAHSALFSEELICNNKIDSVSRRIRITAVSSPGNFESLHKATFCQIRRWLGIIDSIRRPLYNSILKLIKFFLLSQVDCIRIMEIRAWGIIIRYFEVRGGLNYLIINPLLESYTIMGPPYLKAVLLDLPFTMLEILRLTHSVVKHLGPL